MKTLGASNPSPSLAVEEKPISAILGNPEPRDQTRFGIAKKTRTEYKLKATLLAVKLGYACSNVVTQKLLFYFAPRIDLLNSILKKSPLVL
ncbi:hypothetical protein CEXT_811691 [Caerostris extrusa]|uniref:Uncharacterized protein n=1 Tax=Caerostris extrusa TaxID=172846 RepID=A0AAV4TVD6_CAEEX|nr:hypothetical protein CEXT_811691 [Caerostris extrusa]